MLRGKAKLRVLSGLLIAILMFNCLPVFASYNGGSSTKTADGKSAVGSSAGVEYKNQLIKCSLYFCSMDGVTMDGTEASRDEMDARWKAGTHIQQIGKSIYIGRNNVNPGNGGWYYTGSIASSDLFKAQNEAHVYREKTNLNIPYYTLSSLGMEEDMPVAIINSATPAGRDSKSYFMTKRSDYVEGQTSEYDTKENMRKLIHAISGKAIINGKVLDVVSFSRSESGLATFNADSDFDSGMHNGQLGEYKLYLENCIVIGPNSDSSTIVTVRDAIKAELLSDSDRKYYQTGTVVDLGNNFYLDKADTFSLKGKTGNITGKGNSAFNTLSTALNNGKGYGVNILSSELFRDPKTRSIASHINVFLPMDSSFTAKDSNDLAKYTKEGTQNTGVAAVGMEFIGNKVSNDVAYKEARQFFGNMNSAVMLKEIINNAISSGASTSDPNLIAMSIRRDEFFNEGIQYSSEIGDTGKAVNIYKNFDSNTIADAVTAALRLEAGLDADLQNLDPAMLEIFNMIYEYNKQGSIEMFNGNTSNEKYVNGAIILEAKGRSGDILEQAKNQDSQVYSSEVINALDGSTQLVVNNEWENAITKLNYEDLGELSTIVSGEAMVSVFGDNMQSAQLPKGIVKDISTTFLSDLGTLVNHKVDSAKRQVYGGTGFDGYEIGDSSEIDEFILSYLGGNVDNQFTAGSTNGTEYDYIEISGQQVKEGLEGNYNSELLKSYLPSTYNGTGLYEYPIVTINKTEDASYGVVKNGNIECINVDVLGINHALESALSLAPYGGQRVAKPTSWIEQDYATGTRPIKQNLVGVQILPSRWVSSLDNTTVESIIADASGKAIKESQNYKNAVDSGRMTHVISDAIDGSNNVQAVDEVLGSNSETPKSEGRYIQASSNSLLNSILPEENSEIGDRGWGRVGIKGNYAVSYNIYDTSIPVDIILLVRDKDGNLKPVTPTKSDGTQTLAYVSNAYRVNSGMEKVLNIQESWVIPGKNNEEFRVTPKEAIVKPAWSDLSDFLKEMNNMQGDTLKFKQDELEVVSKLKKAPFQVNLGSGAREITSKSEGVNDSLSGTPTSLENNGIVNNAISIVATNSDEEAYMENKELNRMALVLVVDIEYNIDQYNVIDFKDEDGNVIQTIVEKVKPVYTADEKGIQLEPSRTDAKDRTAKMVGWRTSSINEQPNEWSNVTALDRHLGGEYPIDIIPQTKDECYNVYVHYVWEEKPKEVVNTIELSQKRISQIRNLGNNITGTHWDVLGLGVAPTIKFRWSAVDREECCGDHGPDSDCDSCCYERLSDKDYTLVSTNTTDLNAEIIGTSTGFYPYDTNNATSGNRDKSAGSYNMTPDYVFTTWRGQDIPVLASYKYNGEIINSLLKSTGATEENINNKSGSKYRNINNNGIYVDEFIITEGKADVDTNSQANFATVFGNGSLTDAQSNLKKSVQEYEDNCEELHDAKEKEIKALKSEIQSAKSQVNKYNNYANKARWSDSGYYNGYRRSHWIDKRDAAQSDLDTLNSELEALENRMEELEAEIEAFKDSLKANKNKAGNIADYKYSTYMSKCRDFLGFSEIMGNSIKYRTQINVKVYYGEPNSGTKDTSDYHSANLSAFGEDYKNVIGTPINNDVNIKFWPYVEMLYDTTTGEKNVPVNVLGGHESILKPNDYVEIGYLTAADRGLQYVNDNGTGLKVESQQWSTHKTANNTLAKKLGLSGTDHILPGGAIYRLRVPTGFNVKDKSETGRTKVAISSWFTFLPSDTVGAVTEGGTTYDGSKANARHTEMIDSIRNSLDKVDVILNVNGTDIQNGVTKVKGTSSENNKLSTEDKYKLKRDAEPTSTEANEADLDIVKEYSENIYYRVYSDVQGNVYVSKSTSSAGDTVSGKGEVLGSINKTQSFNDLVAGWETDAKKKEIQALNNRTKVVENYIDAIDRNKGWDDTLENQADYTWYNEAFDGICVKRVNTIMELGFKDNSADGEDNWGNVARTAVLDPKLQPIRENQSDLYGKGVKAYFHTEGSSGETVVGSRKIGSDTTVEVKMREIQELFRSKTFGIPNVSVMDLY